MKGEGAKRGRVQLLFLSEIQIHIWVAFFALVIIEQKIRSLLFVYSIERRAGLVPGGNDSSFHHCVPGWMRPGHGTARAAVGSRCADAAWGGCECLRQVPALW